MEGPHPFLTIVGLLVARPQKNIAADPAETDLWIFRDGRRHVSGRAMVCDLSRRISQGNSRSLLDSLIQAGELEAALWDSPSPGARAPSHLPPPLPSILSPRHLTPIPPTLATP